MPVGAGPPATGPRARPGALGISPEQDGPAAGGQWEAKMWEGGQGLRNGCQLAGVGNGFIPHSRCLGRKGEKGRNSRSQISGAPGVWGYGGGWCLTLCPQALQADLCGAAERIDALLAFGEGLAQRSEPQARASLEQVLRALRAHRGSIFRRLWWLQAQLVSSSLVWPALAAPAQVPIPHPP